MSFDQFITTPGPNPKPNPQPLHTKPHNCMTATQYPQFQLLSDFLKKEGITDTTAIDFKEVSDRDNRYALEIECESTELLTKLARFYGCPEEDLPEGEKGLEASDHWHGCGEGDLREFGDELGQYNEQFFDITLTVKEINRIAAE